jgi:2-methylaconitate cis-trans-isomerase PrpF
MIAYLAEAFGAPCPTLVVDAGALPTQEAPLREALTGLREWLTGMGAAHVLKLALVAASTDPAFDLDYRFVQCLDGGLDEFDFHGSCGHSLLPAVLFGVRTGILEPLRPGRRVRVRVLNNGDVVECGVQALELGCVRFNVSFQPDPSPALTDLLLTGHLLDRVDTPAGSWDVSIVSFGNAYVVVDAADLGLRSAADLFEAGRDVLVVLAQIRAAAAARLGWPADGVFPKVAAVIPDRPGRFLARAISVPSWHPSLALTGVACLAAATQLAGSIPARCAAIAPGRREILIRTPGGTSRATIRTGSPGSERRVLGVDVADQRVRLVSGPLTAPLPRPRTLLW